MGKKSIEIPVRKLGYFGKGTGLMFRNKETRNLLFDFNTDGKRAIHSYFVFFNFLAIWFDERNNLVEFKIVKPFTLSIVPSKNYRKLVEVPVNSKNRKIIDFFVGKGNI